MTCCVCVLFFREQRQKEATKVAAVVNSFPKDRDYRREAMQAAVTTGFSSTSKCPGGPCPFCT